MDLTLLQCFDVLLLNKYGYGVYLQDGYISLLVLKPPFAPPVTLCFKVSRNIHAHTHALVFSLSSSRAATPGNTLPSSSSSDAPPPVEM